MNFDEMTVEEMDQYMDNLDRVSTIIIDERRRMEAVELIGEQIQLDLNIEFVDDRIE
jgi:hypothetical protein